MIPSKKQIKALHQRYAPNTVVLQLVYEHCQIVAEIALWCVEHKRLNVNKRILEASCLLHDIGTYALYSENDQSKNDHNYKQHAIFGAALVLEEGFDVRIASAIKTHVLMGLSKKEIVKNGFGMPHKDYLPETIEGRLLCYADRFHSKTPVFNAYGPFLERISETLPEQAKKLQLAAKEFGLPDIESLAKKYNHPIRT